MAHDSSQSLTEDPFASARGLSVGFASESTIQVSNAITDTAMLLDREQLDGVIGMLNLFRMSLEAHENGKHSRD